MKRELTSISFLREHGALPQDAVMKFLARLGRLFAKRGKDLDRSKLVGLYLAQANGQDGAASEYHLRRQRRNGKHTHTRERA
jgi:hypothetical protein